MINISEAIALALNSYQTGNLSQAELLYQQILQQQPNNPEALHWLGVIAHQLGKLKEAIAYYQQTLAVQPNQSEVYYNLGNAFQQQGDLAAAINHYQQALALKPDYTDAYYNLGYALQQQGDLSAAINHYQQALALNPNDAEAHGNLAYVFQQQDQIEAAIAHYQQVIALRPDVPEIYYNLGNLLRQQNQLESAINYYQWAVALNPNYADAYLQLGASLHSSGQQEDAIFCYQQAISLKPNAPDAYYKLGNALLERGRHSEAIVPYQQALVLEPHFLDAYLQLGWALMHLSQFEEAATYFQQALMLNPEHPEAYQKLALALVSQNKLDEALGYFQKALQLKPDFVGAYWQSQLILPILYDTQEQIRFWRQRFSRGLNHFIQQTTLDTPENIKQALTGLTGCATTFYLSYQGFNDRGLQRKYGKFIHQVISAVCPQWAIPLSMPPLSSTGKIRIGYLSAHLREHTVAMLTGGWLKNCDKQKFEIYGYHIGHQADLITETLRSYTDSFYHIYGSLEAVCKQVIADKLHILVFTDIGMEPLTTYIAGLRLAPVQCMAWGHPVTSGLPTIDYFLSSDLMEPENAQAHYSEKLVRLPNISICYEKPLVPELTKTRSYFHLREASVIYLCCQSSFKYLPQFDSIFAQIAQRVPQAQFAFISHSVPAITAQFQARLRGAFAKFGLNSEDYCVIVPRLERIDYFNLNLVSDIFLDTFSWSGGNTTLEAIACGLPVVTCPGEFMRSRHSYGILKMMGVTQTIAQDEAEYVEIAVRLALEADWRQEIVQKIYERHSWLYEDKTCVTALESFYEKVVLQHRLFS
ncbi:MAG TPA: tetratricopeptide repeat protein [Coleofasciculaceae cyanobacterium]|jgi:predicted O-linked N-acetylglucosamine transferase (SPINDLY family)